MLQGAEEGRHSVSISALFLPLPLAPHDYFRFTRPCVERLLRDHGFEIAEIRTSGGRASALVEILFPTKVGKARNLLYKFLQRLDRFLPNSDSFIDSISVKAKKT